MISAKLTKICEEASLQCRVPQLLRELSKEDADSLLEALRNTAVPRRAIVRILREEGYTIARESIQKASDCLTGKNECKCNLGGENK